MIVDALKEVQLGTPADLVAGQLFEILGTHAGGWGAFAYAGRHAAKLQQQKQTLAPVHRWKKSIPKSKMPPEESEFLGLMNDIFQMLQRAHLRANDQLQSLGIRYEIRERTPFPDLRRLTTTVPDMNISVQVRDVFMPRRKPQVLRYLVTLSRRQKRIALRVLDPKKQMRMAPDREVFKVDPSLRAFQIENFEDKLVANLVARARRGFRR